MNRDERMDWIISIENSAAIISAELGPAVVNSLLARYNARSICDISPSNLSEVFSELYAIEADLK
jgi:hypothetical protein